MTETVTRVALPSGGWWDLVTVPLWKHVRQWGARSHGEARQGLVEHALVSLTTGWSFREEVSVGALALRDREDVVAALEAFEREVVPRLEGSSPSEMAEELFAGLMAGRVPPYFYEAHLMASTGWSWRELQETPAEVVEMLGMYLAVRQAMDVHGSLDFRHADAGDQEKKRNVN